MAEYADSDGLWTMDSPLSGRIRDSEIGVCNDRLCDNNIGEVQLAMVQKM